MGRGLFFTGDEWDSYVDKLKAREKHKRLKKRDREAVTRRNKWGMISSGVGLLGKGASYLWKPAGVIGKVGSAGIDAASRGEWEDGEDRTETKLANADNRQEKILDLPYTGKQLYDIYNKFGGAGLRNTVEGAGDRATATEVLRGDLPKGEKGDSLLSRIYNYPANKFKQLKGLYQSARDELHDRGILKDDKNAFYDNAGEMYQEYVKNGGDLGFKGFLSRQGYTAQKNKDDSEDEGVEGVLRKGTEFGGSIIKDMGFDKITGVLGFVPIVGNWLQKSADSAFQKMEQNEMEGQPITKGVMSEVKKNVNVKALADVGTNVFKHVMRNKYFGDRNFSENNPHVSLSPKSGGDYEYNKGDFIVDFTKFVRDSIEGYVKGGEISDFTKNPKDKVYSTLGAAFDSATGALDKHMGRKESDTMLKAFEGGNLEFLGSQAPRSKSAHEYLTKLQDKIKSGEIWEQKNQANVDSYNRSLMLAQLKADEKKRLASEREKNKMRRESLKKKGKEKKPDILNIWGNTKEEQAVLNGEVTALNIPAGPERDAYFQDKELYLANHPTYKKKGGLNLNIGGMQIAGGQGGWQNTNRYIRDKNGVLIDTQSPAFKNKKKKGMR